MRPTILALALAACLLPPALAVAAEGRPAAASAKAAPADSVPTKITSDRMNYNHNDQTLVFLDNVFVDREDFKLWSKKITVHFVKDETSKAVKPAEGTPGSESIDRIEAEGSVRMEREGRTGECETAVYQVREGLLTMRGNPILREGPNKVQGEVIRFSLKDNRSEVLSGGKSKVEAIFYSPKNSGGMKMPGER